MKDRGFTLVEMLVVLAVIATLAGIGIPVGRSLIGKSREAACLKQLQSLGVGIESYMQDHGRTLPDLVAVRASKSDDVPVLDTVLLPYLETPEAFHCPDDRKEFAKTGSSYWWNKQASGKRPDKVFFFSVNQDHIPLIVDKDAWHPSGVNILHMDLSASNQLRFAASN